MLKTTIRGVSLCAVGATLALTTGCDFADDLLEVNNPDEIQIEALNDPALLDVQLNGVIDGFTGAYENPSMTPFN